MSGVEGCWVGFEVEVEQKRFGDAGVLGNFILSAIRLGRVGEHPAVGGPTRTLVPAVQLQQD